MFTSSRNLGTAVLTALCLLVGIAAAQHPTFETGAVDAIIGEGAFHAYTYATEVPADVADGEEDERVRAILEAIAGTTQHSASFMHVDEMKLGTTVLTPPTLYVTLSTRTHHPERSDIGSFMLQFALDPETLELLEEADVELKFYPRGSSYDDYYAFTEGVFELLEVTVVDDVTLAVSGTFSGALSYQTDYDVVHNPDDALAVEGSFTVARVVSNDAAFKLLMVE